MDNLGLSDYEAKQRLKKYGPNTITTHERRTPLTIFLAQFPTFLNAILLMAATFSFVLGDIVDGGFIVAIIILNGVFGFIQEYKAEKSLEKLKSYASPMARVLRDGKEKEIPTAQLVEGDVVILTEGDRIPADGTLIKSVDLEVNEAILTGESLPVRKELNSECFLGTLIVRGKGMLRIHKTGNATRFGQIAETLATITPERTPLQTQLISLGRRLSIIAIAIAFILIPFGIWQGLLPQTLFLLVISVAVAAIPEGLPAVITIALALGTNRMAKRKTIVRQMPAIETLGAVQVIIVDKTGTLTENSMRVKHVSPVSKEAEKHMYLAASLGNTASLIRKADSSFDIVGDTTDGALLLWVHENAPETNARIEEGTIVDEFVFDSETKTITTVWKHGEKHYVYVRGAPESVLASCHLTKKELESFKKTYTAYAQQGLRVIGFGYKTGFFRDGTSRQKHEKNLTFLGFVALYDPPRPEVKKAVEQAKRAGIRTIMVTGDNEVTALSIAKEIGLIDKNEDVITGDELKKIRDEELLQLIPRVSVFARSQPHDKLRIATLLQQQGFIVGVTGDGVNDALALKQANVGISMGETGTDVAKESSDIILTDDNFSTLVKAIEEGRAIYRNIVTAILYLLTTNLSELLLVLFSTILELPLVLRPTQILWINLITDGFPALALATETSSRMMLFEPPRDPKDPLLTTKRLIRILLGGSSLAIVLIICYIILLGITDQTVARTIIFNALIFSHMVLALLVRGRPLRTASAFLLLTIAVTVIVQSMITFLPFFQRLFAIGV